MRYKKSHRITYGRECRFCGDILDPGEECECVRKRREKREKQAEADMLASQEGPWAQQELAIV